MMTKDARARILLIDDPDEWRDFAAKALTEAGYAVTVPQNVAEYASLRKFRNHLQQFDLIIVDPILQEGDAIDILYRISQTSQGNSTIAMTSTPTIDLVKQTMKMGVRNVSPKPYQAQKLLEVIESTLQEIRDPGFS
jgi:DNA-binding NtrC family response regulator